MSHTTKILADHIDDVTTIRWHTDLYYYANQYTILS